MMSRVTGLGEKSRNEASERVPQSSPFPYASAALTSGSQSVIAMARSSSIAIESAAQDGSCWPIVAYSVQRPRSTWASAMRCSGASMGLPPTQMR